jgi:outer membrane protein TolC
MILSGSSLWSPLASVIACGLIFSMFFTLLVIPVLFVVIKSRSVKQGAVAAVVIAACVLLAGGREAIAETARHSLTLSQAVELALKRNSLLQISRSKVDESDQKIVSARSQYFPQLSNDTKYLALSEKQTVTVPAGSLGNVGGNPFPEQETKVKQGDSTFLLSETTLAQPTTQLLKIHESNRIARADRGIAAGDLKRSENEIAFAVHQFYYALLIAYKEKEAAEAALTAAQENLREAEDGVRTGTLLDVAVTAARADLLRSRHAVLSAETRISDVTSELNDLMGLPSNDILEVTHAGLPPLEEPSSKDDAYHEAHDGNGELLAARETLEKSRHAVGAAKYEYIPDVTIFAKHMYQDGAAFLEDQVGIFGVELSWNIFDWGKRKGEVGQRLAQQAQAATNLARIDKRIGIEIDMVLRKLERLEKMVDVAREALSLSRENARLSEDRLKAETVTAAKHAEAVAAFKKAERDELQSSLAYRLARMELDRITGTLASGR